MGLAGLVWARTGAALVLLLGSGLMLAGCSTTGDDTQAMAMLPPPQANPVQDSTVASNNLPPIGSDGSVSAAPNNTSMLPPNSAIPGSTPVVPTGDNGFANGAPPPGAAGTDSMQTATATPGVNTGSDSSFVSLNDMNASAGAGTGRDLSGGLTVEKLLGGWTVSSGSTSCRLNLTYSQKAGTERYRASAPNCAIPALNSVASWQLVGGQIQLFNDSGAQIANLLQSGGRFIGALSGGQGISMAG